MGITGFNTFNIEYKNQVNDALGECIMGILNFIISIVALIIAIIAFQRTGGTKDLKKNTAELLAKVEKKMREEEPDIEEEKKQ